MNGRISERGEYKYKPAHTIMGHGIMGRYSDENPADWSSCFSVKREKETNKIKNEQSTMLCNEEMIYE